MIGISLPCIDSKVTLYSPVYSPVLTKKGLFDEMCMTVCRSFVFIVLQTSRPLWKLMFTSAHILFIPLLLSRFEAWLFDMH